MHVVNPCINIGPEVMRPRWVMKTGDENKWINNGNNNKCENR